MQNLNVVSLNNMHTYKEVVEGRESIDYQH